MNYLFVVPPRVAVTSVFAAYAVFGVVAVSKIVNCSGGCLGSSIDEGCSELRYAQ
jgi:hypothetical protein